MTSGTMLLSRFPKILRYEGGGSLKDRLLTALIVLAVAVGISYLAMKLPHGGLICVAWATVVVGMSTFEVVRLFARDPETLKYQPVRGVILFAVMMAPALGAVVSTVERVVNGAGRIEPILVGAVIGVVGMMICQVWEGRDQLRFAAVQGERYVSAFLLVSLCGIALIVLSGLPYAVSALWWMVGLSALNDAAAYFTGRSVGKRKLAPAISPNKTVEGSLGGLIVGSVAGFFLWHVMISPTTSAVTIVLICILACVAAQTADLHKSYLKRLRGVKDTGAIFPGHGGILDRFDAMLGAAPIVLAGLAMLGTW